MIELPDRARALRPAALLLSSLLFAGCAAGSEGTGPFDARADATLDATRDATGPALEAAVAADGAPVGDAGGDGPRLVSEAGSDARGDATVVAPRCGDGACSAPSETCESCPLDCDVCPRCDMAPTCTGALAVPTTTTPLAGCNNYGSSGFRGNYSCGADLGVPPSRTTCADPQLRIRLREISIERGFFDIAKTLYCVVSAEDGMHSELMVTSPRRAAGNRETTRINFRPSESVLWGQGDLYRSIANITITYACFLSSNSEGAQRVLDDISGRAAMVAAHADGYGWVFGTVSVLGTIIGSSLSTVRDTQILDVQQTIAASALLPMTNGRTWEIRQERGNLSLSGASDLRLTFESWGCADVRTRVP